MWELVPPKAYFFRISPLLLLFSYLDKLHKCALKTKSSEKAAFFRSFCFRSAFFRAQN